MSDVERLANALLDALEEARRKDWRLNRECGDGDCRVCPPRLELKKRVEEAMTELSTTLER